MTLLQRLGLQIKEKRKARDLTQQALGELSDRPQTRIAEIENGRSNVTMDTLESVADALGCDVEISLVDRSKPTRKRGRTDAGASAKRQT